MLKQRVVTALILVAALLLILFWLPPLYAVAAFAVIAALAAWEWSRLVSGAAQGFTPNQVWFPLLVVLCCSLCQLRPSLQFPLCLIAAGFWLIVPFWFAKRWSMKSDAVAYLVGIILIVPTWVGMTQLHALGPWTLLAAMALVWVADISAYFVGRAVGRHKLAPAISPGKTWEGAAGALIGGLLYVFVLQQFANIALPKSIAVAGLTTALLVAVSIIGDLFESMIKRQAGVKDSSQLLPGHGGVLDRIDSLTSTLPVLVAAIGVWSTLGQA